MGENIRLGGISLPLGNRVWGVRVLSPLLYVISIVRSDSFIVILRLSVNRLIAPFIEMPLFSVAASNRQSPQAFPLSASRVVASSRPIGNQP